MIVSVSAPISTAAGSAVVTEAVSPSVPGPGVSSRLVPLTGLRFFAALHIFVFHIAAMPTMDELQVLMQQGSQAAMPGEAGADIGTGATVATSPETPSDASADSSPENLSRRPVDSPPGSKPAARSPEAMAAEMQNRGLYAVLPKPLGRFLQRGYLSTGLFFMLSGFVLAYLYVDRDGHQTVSDREFWLNRIARLYPLHLLMLLFLIPMAVAMLSFMPSNSLWGIPVSKPVFGVVTGLMSVLLVQAWCPEAALTWNFATWALSAVAFFYLVFPAVVRFLARQSRTTLWGLFWLMPVLNLVPTLIFLWKGEGAQTGLNFWSEFVMRTPLFWLPHFVMAIILCRLFQITRHDMRWVQPGDRTGWRPGLGDLAALVIVMVSITPDEVFSRWFGLQGKPPNFILRHGFMCPLYAVFLYELAQNRGIVARLLSHRWCETLGEASFGIFIFQGPFIFPALLLFGFVAPHFEAIIRRFTDDPGTVTATLEIARVVLTVVPVVMLALLSVRYFEKPVARRLKKRWGLLSTEG